MKNRIKRLIWKYVYSELVKVPIFSGTYDFEHAQPQFMNGITTVMEYIARKAGRDTEYDRLLSDNREKSRSKYRGF